VTNAEVRDRVLAALAGLPVTSRAMFGGYGFWLDGRYFGIASEGAAWFRAGDENREAYLSRGMPAFQPKNRPRGPRTVDRNFRVPDEVLDDASLLAEWAVRAARSNTPQP
jgi:DNA transformation protein